MLTHGDSPRSHEGPEGGKSEPTLYNGEDSLRCADVYPPGGEFEEVGEVLARWHHGTVWFGNDGG
jgi:hypothetical protein